MILFTIIYLIVVIALLVLPVVATVSLLKNRYCFSNSELLLWLIAIWLINPIGGIVFFVVND